MAGNWKMYKTPAETTAFFEKFRPLVEKSEHCEIVICPPFTNLAAAVDAAKGTRIRDRRAEYRTGPRKAPSPARSPGPMLKPSGASHAIIGHSERRQYFGETDETVLKRTQAALESGLTPIVCVGERLEERESGQHRSRAGRRSSRRASPASPPQQFAKIVIAYEPVWAIGTGKTATPEIAADAHRVIRAQVRGEVRQGRRRRRAHSVWRQRQAGQREDPDGAAGNRRRAGGRREPGPGGLRVDRELLIEDSPLSIN